MSKEQAHAVLDELKNGVPHPMTVINAALVATGDLGRWRQPEPEKSNVTL